MKMCFRDITSTRASIILTITIILSGILYILVGLTGLNERLAKAFFGEYTIASTVIITSGTLTFISGWFKLCYVCKNNKYKLVKLMIAVLSLLLLKVAAAILPYIQKQDLERNLRHNMKKSLHYYQNDTNVRDLWDYVQSSLKCCGVIQALEYEVLEIAAPYSCCDFNNKSKNCVERFLREGCFFLLYNILEVKYVQMITNTLSIACAQIVIALICFLAIFRLRRKENASRKRLRKDIIDLSGFDIKEEDDWWAPSAETLKLSRERLGSKKRKERV